MCRDCHLVATPDRGFLGQDVIIIFSQHDLAKRAEYIHNLKKEAPT
jgi:hypothetical protein